MSSDTVDERGSVVLSRAECWRLLDRGAGGVGRLALSLGERIAIVPLNYARCRGGIMLLLGPGSTLEAISRSPSVAFEIDHVDPGGAAPEAWSVLAQGTATIVREPLELGQASSLGLTPYVPDAGQVYVRVRVEALSGRRFSVGALARYRLLRTR